jgi:enoyl-CoA hydratase
MTAPATTAADASVLVRREGRAGRLTLNRPGTLNALNFEMVRTLTAALQAWAKDPAVELVILDGAGGRALCAGGDVVDLISQRTDPARPWRQFWREEYQLNALIHRYPKPFAALMDGIVMGGGIGLSAHARYRIVTERSMLAMPETTWACPGRAWHVSWSDRRAHDRVRCHSMWVRRGVHHVGLTDGNG